jgi:acetate---CoA ligase (ADP-forming)
MSSLDIFFQPTSIAIIGASRTPGEIGYEVLKNVKSTFNGQIYPINPDVTEIENLITYNSISNIEGQIDLAIILNPAKEVLSVLTECSKKGIKAAIIVSSGFSAKEEIKLLDYIKKLSKDRKMRVIGPSSLGLYSKELDMLYLPKKRLKRPVDGYISFISQSGGIGATLMDVAASEGIGINKFIAVGSASDVDEIELLDYLGKDMQTRCIAIYVESMQNGKQLIEKAKKIVKDKPIIILKAGKGELGVAAAEEHSGHFSAKAKIYSAAFRQAGIIEAQTVEDFFNHAKSLANQPILKNNKIGIITNAGGFGVIAVDEASRLGLQLGELSKETIKSMKTLPSHISKQNPLDLGGSASADMFQTALNSLFKEKEISGIVCISLLQTPALEERVISVIRESKLHGKPITVCMTGSEYTKKFAIKLEEYGIPVYNTPEKAVKSMNVLLTYNKILKSLKQYYLKNNL